jgi:hypothetical protein
MMIPRRNGITLKLSHNVKVIKKETDFTIAYKMSTEDVAFTPDEEMIAARKREALRNYNRDYYHANNMPQVCKRCSKIYSSVSAVRRHELRNHKCRMLQMEQRQEQMKVLISRHEASQSSPSQSA